MQFVRRARAKTLRLAESLCARGRAAASVVTPRRFKPSVCALYFARAQQLRWGRTLTIVGGVREALLAWRLGR
jgi:hypothetical protein